jgi:hypothetical protein
MGPDFGGGAFDLLGMEDAEGVVAPDGWAGLGEDDDAAFAAFEGGEFGVDHLAGINHFAHTVILTRTANHDALPPFPEKTGFLERTTLQMRAKRG